MASPTCNATTLISNAVCYQHGPLNREQQLAMLIYGMQLELTAIGGTDYAGQLVGTLLTESNLVVGTLKPDRILAGLIARQFANAAEAGATVPDDMDDKMAAIKCLQHIPGGEMGLFRLILWLFCKLGRSEGYPQT